MQAVKSACRQRFHGETSTQLFLIALLAFTVFEGLWFVLFFSIEPYSPAAFQANAEMYVPVLRWATLLL